MGLSNKSRILVGLVGLSMAGSASATAEAMDRTAAGLQQMADGLQALGQQAAEARSAMEAKTQKFVDVAGNVYDVLTDSLGQATKFVVDSTGAILDSTKIAGQFVLETLANYPGDVREGLGERYVLLAWLLSLLGRDAAFGFAHDVPPRRDVRPHAYSLCANASLSFCAL